MSLDEPEIMHGKGASSKRVIEDVGDEGYWYAIELTWAVFTWRIFVGVVEVV